jgi:hypothetical protein
MLHIQKKSFDLHLYLLQSEVSIYRHRLQMLFFFFSYEKVKPCTCTVNAKPCLLKSRQARVQKSLKYYCCGNKTWHFSEKDMASKLSQRKDGETSILWLQSIFLLGNTLCSCWPTFTAASWDTPTPSSLVHVGACTYPYQRDTKLRELLLLLTSTPHGTSGGGAGEGTLAR